MSTMRTSTRASAPARPARRGRTAQDVDTRAGFWLQAATVAITVIAVVVRCVVGDAADHTFAAILNVAIRPAAILLPVAGVLLVTSEWSQRTGMITFALVPVRSRVLGTKVIASLVLALAMLVMSVAVAAAGVLVASPGGEGILGRRRTLDRPVSGVPDHRDDHGRRVRHGPVGARRRRARTLDAASDPHRHLADHAAGDRRVNGVAVAEVRQLLTR